MWLWLAIIFPPSSSKIHVQAHVDCKEFSEQILENRALLISVMHAHGFKVLATEWWHFDFVGWEKYPLLDISFDELEEKPILKL